MNKTIAQVAVHCTDPETNKVGSWLTAFDKTELVASIRPGDRVTILVPSGFGLNGQEYAKRTGKARLCFDTHAVINLGGRFGTPGVATPDNIVSVRKARRPQTSGEKAQTFLQKYCP